MKSVFMKHVNGNPFKAFCALGVLLGLSAVGYGVIQNQQVKTVEFASRATELGVARPQPLKEIKNKNVLLNDPAIDRNWGIALTSSRKAWEISQGSRDIVVAVIDTGIDLNHPDLKNNLWINKGEVGLDKNEKDKGSNGIDDDGNGFIDDVHGWNFVSNNNSLVDNHGHGTHIAGIIGAEGGNKVGISGVAPKVSLMILKYYDPKAPGVSNLNNTVKAIDYAIKMNAKIINYSGGGLDQSKSEIASIKKAREKGILFVAAAGNERSNSDIRGYYPADYDIDNIISVTAIDPDEKILPSSNYGKRTVDIAAPGLDIYSTLVGGEYGYLTGTSQATAFVSGVAALIMAQNPDWSANRVAKYIIKTGDKTESLKGKTQYQVKLNSARALQFKGSGIAANGVAVTNFVGKNSHIFATDTDNQGGSNLGGLRQLATFIEKSKENQRLVQQPRNRNRARTNQEL